MNRVLFASALSLAFAQGSAQAVKAFETGNSLHMKMMGANGNDYAYAYGYGYVSAISDAWQGDFDPNTKSCFRVPDESTKGQVFDVVKPYLEQHPQDRHFTAASQVQIALSRAFPCRSR